VRDGGLVRAHIDAGALGLVEERLHGVVFAGVAVGLGEHDQGDGRVR